MENIPLFTGFIYNRWCRISSMREMKHLPSIHCKILKNFPRRNPISAAETEKQSFPGAFQLPRRGVAMEEGEWERACDQLGGVSQGGAIASTPLFQKKTWNSVGTSMSVCACSSFCLEANLASLHFWRTKKLHEKSSHWMIVEGWIPSTYNHDKVLRWHLAWLEPFLGGLVGLMVGLMYLPSLKR